jgi:hypothetical protein
MAHHRNHDPRGTRVSRCRLSTAQIKHRVDESWEDVCPQMSPRPAKRPMLKCLLVSIAIMSALFVAGCTSDRSHAPGTELEKTTTTTSTTRAADVSVQHGFVTVRSGPS